MRGIALFCSAFAISVLAGPVAAQQSTPEQQPAATEQPQQTQPPPLPPFPSMPHHAVRSTNQATPHEHYPGGSDHHGSPSAKHHAGRHQPTRDHHHATQHARSDHATQHNHAAQLSKRTIRQCHQMTYKQIMGHPNCRSLMMQDLETHEHRQASKRHKTKHHETKHHETKQHSTKHHASTHHRGTAHHH